MLLTTQFVQTGCELDKKQLDCLEHDSFTLVISELFESLSTSYNFC